MAAVPVLCRYPLTTAWIIATLTLGTSAFGGQGMRFFPIRMAPLGSPAGTVGGPVTPQFNVDLGCWELQLSEGGVEVDLDVQVFGWGNSDCVQPTGLCRIDPGKDCTIPADCVACVGADPTCLEDNGSGSGDPCSIDADCTQGTETCVPECRDENATCTNNGATCLEADKTGSGGPCISNADCTQGTETCHARLAPCTLGALQATVMSPGYINGVGGDLQPKGWPASPGDGVYQATNVCFDNNDPCRAPFDPTCGGRPLGFCIENDDFVMPSCANPVAALATPTLDYAWATAAQTDCNLDGGEIKTLGGLILEVPVDAAGTYMIDFDTDPNNSFMTAGDGSLVPGVVYTPACITITFACQSDADCDDGFPCTTDSCDEGTSTCENIIAQVFCLIDGVCILNEQQDPTGDCRFCNANLSQTDWSNRLESAPCGNSTDSDCNHADTCDGAGTCLANFEPDGANCTDDGNDCTRDFCLVGRCFHPSWASGTPCGDATDVPCNGADTCDGGGKCLNNLLPDDAPCPNGNFCDGAELCLGGVCQSADPPCDIEDDLCDEQDDECDLLGDHDGDLFVTLLDFLHWPDCETGPVGGPYAVGCEIFDFEQNGFVDLPDYARFQIAFTMP